MLYGSKEFHVKESTSLFSHFTEDGPEEVSRIVRWSILEVATHAGLTLSQHLLNGVETELESAV